MVVAKSEEDLLWDRLLPLLQEVTHVSQRIIEVRQLKEFRDPPSGWTSEGNPTVVETREETSADREAKLQRKREKDRAWRASKRAVEDQEGAPKIGTSAWLRARTSDETAIGPVSTKSQEQRIRDALRKREKRAREKAERELSGG